MATYTIQGTGGSVMLPSNVYVKAREWAADIDTNVIETTGFSDNGWRSKAATILSMTGTVTGVGDASYTPLPASLFSSTAGLSYLEGEFTLQATSGCTLWCAGVITSVEYNRAADGALELTLSFKSNGEIRQTWDVSA